MAKIVVVTVVKNQFDALLLTGQSIASKSSKLLWIVQNGGEPLSLSEKKQLAFLVKDFCLIEEKDSGIYSAMNKSLRFIGENKDLHESDWIWFLNAGDTVSSIELLLKYVNQVSVEKDVLIIPVLLRRDGDNTILIHQYFDLHEFVSGKLKMCHQGVLSRLRFMDKKVIFPESYQVASDFHFMLRVLKEARVEFVEGVAVNWDLHGFSSYHLIHTEWEKVKILFFFSIQNPKLYILKGLINHFIVFLKSRVKTIIKK
jgi:hypothetical protein